MLDISPARVLSAAYLVCNLGVRYLTHQHKEFSSQKEIPDRCRKLARIWEQSRWPVPQLLRGRPSPPGLCPSRQQLGGDPWGRGFSPRGGRACALPRPHPGSPDSQGWSQATGTLLQLSDGPEGRDPSELLPSDGAVGPGGRLSLLKK